MPSSADLGGAGPELTAGPLAGSEDLFAPDIDVRWFGPGGDEMHVTAHLTPLNIDPRARYELLKRRSIPGNPIGRCYSWIATRVGTPSSRTSSCPNRAGPWLASWT